MSSRPSLALSLLLAGCAPALAADDAPPLACPALPASAGLHWETRDQGAFLLCRAMDAGDQQAFGIMLTRDKPDIRLDKRLRAEAGAVNGQGMYWYYPNAGGNALKNRRIAVVEVGEDRYAQIWIDAPDEPRMQSLQNVVRELSLR
ncbi:hypothetical protein [Pseudoxanthomonas composti]|uniref:Uncharacterized protein n=1 Tax=Pseudoxanthomonas composti TaxID=2137479 RepID=A0A4Q1JU79_9GAMM|nr:hypothetical protein [Pseudoxanthomonas composti]RXR05251.1 hypothetical protein EPA99_10915 [Pseudoxanthomonas composti]